MTRDEQEMALWREAYWACRVTTPAYRATKADDAVIEFRLRYPPQPTAPPAVWYDEPPFEKDGVVHRCWVEGFAASQEVYWLDLNGEWRFFERLSDARPLAGRRVSPIHRPPEPTT